MNNQLKYAIKDHLEEWKASIPYLEYVAKRAKLIEAMGVSDPHFRAIINYRIDSTNEARASQLRAAADYIGVPMEALFNQVSASNEG